MTLGFLWTTGRLQLIWRLWKSKSRRSTNWLTDGWAFSYACGNEQDARQLRVHFTERCRLSSTKHFNLQDQSSNYWSQFACHRHCSKRVIGTHEPELRPYQFDTWASWSWKPRRLESFFLRCFCGIFLAWLAIYSTASIHDFYTLALQQSFGAPSIELQLDGQEILKRLAWKIVF